MSGRDVEPVAAFFPSIDRNLMRDLDRHLRGSQPAEAQPPRPVEAQPTPIETRAAAPAGGAKRTIDTIVEAVEQAASTIAAMTDRIRALEATIDDMQAVQHDMAMQFAAAVQRHDVAEAALRTERERCERAEGLAAHHVARGNRLDLDLATTLADLTRVTDAIASTLGLPDHQEPGG